MELLIMSLGGSLIALCLQLSELIGRTAVSLIHAARVFAGHTGARREPTQARRRMFMVVAATALLYAFSPVRAVGSEMSAPAEGPAKAEVSLTQSPLVMRVGKDEFRVAFGINSVGCARGGCYGAIRYRVSWKAEDGITRSDIREVGYTVVPTAARTITVDRQYFDTSEGAHTTDVVEVTVANITCHRGTENRVLSADRTGPARLHGSGHRGGVEDHSDVTEVPQEQ